MPDNRPVPPEVCPLCGKGNQCAMELERATGLKQPPCWCTQAQFSPELLAAVPLTARGKACICAACAATGQAAAPIQPDAERPS